MFFKKGKEKKQLLVQKRDCSCGLRGLMPTRFGDMVSCYHCGRIYSLDAEKPIAIYEYNEPE